MADLYRKFASQPNGLTESEVYTRRAHYGFNEIAGKPPVSWWRKLIAQFADVLVLILIGAGILSFAFGEAADAIVILGIVFLNSLIGFVQEFKAERALETLKSLTAPEARVLRAGNELTIPAKELVPGDVIIIEEGMKVPADARLIEANELKVEEAALTGESVPVHKTVEHSVERWADMVLAGTTVASGSGRAIVIRIGMETEFGKVAKLTTETEKEESPLTKEMKSIGNFVGRVALIISLLLFGIGLWQGRALVESLLFGVAVAVAAVPEGLPVTLTAALAFGVRRLAKQKALMRELKSVETLGATTVICSDKTGTLTQNQMTAVRGFLPGAGEFEITGSGYDPADGGVLLDHRDPAAELFFRIGDQCNEAILRQASSFAEASILRSPRRTSEYKSEYKSEDKQDESGGWQVLGDPTEGALRVAARKFGLPENKAGLLQKFPFDSERKRMSVIYAEGDMAVVYAKGAPERLIERCTHYCEGEQIKILSAEIKKQILAQNHVLAASALRVLGLAYREIPSREARRLTCETAEDQLVFVGLVGLIDPPRPEVASAVELCARAGIKITVITGDYGMTAHAIAQRLKIADAKTLILTGRELAELSDSQLQKILKQNGNLIFARMQPADKLRVVSAYKALDEVVAVTGDGVNDAPALKRADIGIAMGRSGTDVARESASLVLTDDSFASIVAAVREGRQLYANMRKFVLYIFSSNIGELCVIFAAILLGVPAPLTAILILLINLGTDVLPSLALGVDPAEPDIMQRPPRDPAVRMLTRGFVVHFTWLGVVIGTLVMSGYLGVFYFNGWTWGQEISTLLHIKASSFAFATLVTIQLFNAFNFRSEKFSILSLKVKINPYLWAAVLLSFAIVLATLQLPVLQNLLGTTGLSLLEWGAVVALSASVIVVEEVRKLAGRGFRQLS